MVLSHSASCSSFLKQFGTEMVRTSSTRWSIISRNTFWHWCRVRQSTEEGKHLPTRPWLQVCYIWVSHPTGYHVVGAYAQQVCQKSVNWELGGCIVGVLLSTRSSGDWSYDWSCYITMKDAKCNFQGCHRIATVIEQGILRPKSLVKGVIWSSWMVDWSSGVRLSSVL